MAHELASSLDGTGHVCGVPFKIQVDNLMGVVLGSMFPFLLQWQPTDNIFILLEGGYVDGIMDGDVLAPVSGDFGLGGRASRMENR